MATSTATEASSPPPGIVTMGISPNAVELMSPTAADLLNGNGMAPTPSGGAAIMQFGKDPPCCGSFAKVSMMKAAVEVDSGYALCCGFQGFSERQLIARHTIIDYQVVSRTSCCLLGPFAEMCCKVHEIKLVESNGDESKSAAGGLPINIPNEHYFSVDGIHAASNINEQLANYVFGSLSAAGPKLHMASHLINGGIADPLTLSLDLFNKDEANEHETINDDHIFAIEQQGCSSHTRARFFPGFLMINYKNLSKSTYIATYLTSMVGFAMQCVDPCTMEETGTTIPRYMVTNYASDEYFTCCGALPCLNKKNIHLQTLSKNTFQIPCVGAIQLPVWYSFRHSEPVDHAEMQSWVFGDLTRMGDKAHGAAHLVSDGISKKIEMAVELNKLLGADDADETTQLISEDKCK